MVDITERRQNINELTKRLEYEMNKKLISLCYQFNKYNNDKNYKEFDKDAVNFAAKINDTFVELDKALCDIEMLIKKQLP